MKVIWNEWMKILLYDNDVIWAQSAECQSLSVRIIHLTSEAVCDLTATEQNDIRKCH